MIRGRVIALWLGFAVLASVSCAKNRTVEVVNTSGRRQSVMVFDRSLADLYWIDTVEVGRSVCWRVPEFVRNEHVVLVITPTMTESETSGLLPRPKAWTDSIVLDRSWSLRIHARDTRDQADRRESPSCANAKS